MLNFTFGPNSPNRNARNLIFYLKSSQSLLISAALNLQQIGKKGGVAPQIKLQKSPKIVYFSALRVNDDGDGVISTFVFNFWFENLTSESQVQIINRWNQQNRYRLFTSGPKSSPRMLLHVWIEIQTNQHCQHFVDIQPRLDACAHFRRFLVLSLQLSAFHTFFRMFSLPLLCKLCVSWFF